MSNILELSVSQLSSGIKRLVEDNFGYVRVKGEISGFRGASPSGHVYFRLKDENAVIEAVIWKGAFNKLKFKPQEGLEMVATGKVTTFPGSSKYQIVIENLEPAGVGALMAVLEERKARLTKEGLFDAARKKPLPYMPNIIGVVTSPTGAVIRDILHRLQDRFPLHVIIYPVRVQGDGAAEEITRGIEAFQNYEPRPDVIIVARGGGSLEDLWCFNEENVVRAAAASRIPLISAVGHETDTTLIDYASDVRAPTPTAAAEMAVPVKRELELKLKQLHNRLVDGEKRFVVLKRQNLVAISRGLPDLFRLLSLHQQKFDSLTDRLPLALKAMASGARHRYEKTKGQLSISVLKMRFNQSREKLTSLDLRNKNALKNSLALSRQKITQQQERVKGYSERMARALHNRLNRLQDQMTRLSSMMNALSYKGVLSRGYALIRDDKGKPLMSAGAVNPSQKLKIEFSDGVIEALSGVGIKKKGESVPQESLF